MIASPLAAAIALFVISLGAILAGQGYIKTARRMRSYGTVRGRVINRELGVMAAGTREGRWGKGGGYWPKATYVFTVGGVEHTSSLTTYAHRGCGSRSPSRRWPRSRTRSTSSTTRPTPTRPT